MPICQRPSLSVCPSVCYGQINKPWSSEGLFTRSDSPPDACDLTTKVTTIVYICENLRITDPIDVKG